MPSLEAAPLEEAAQWIEWIECLEALESFVKSRWRGTRSHLPSITVGQPIDTSAGERFDAWLDPERVAVDAPRHNHAPRRNDHVRVGGRFEITMHSAADVYPHQGQLVGTFRDSAGVTALLLCQQVFASENMRGL